MDEAEKDQRTVDRRMRGRKLMRGRRGGAGGGAGGGTGGGAGDGAAVGGGNVWTPTTDANGYVYYVDQMSGETSWGDR